MFRVIDSEFGDSVQLVSGGFVVSVEWFVCGLVLVFAFLVSLILVVCGLRVYHVVWLWVVLA